MMEYRIYIVCIMAAFASSTNAQMYGPIPDRPLGFPYGPKVDSVIQLDAFLDLLCPHCNETFPVLLEVANHYGVKDLRLNVLIFTLPWHRSSWLAAQSTYVIDDMNSEATFKWMSDMFAVQRNFDTHNTINKSDNDIMSMMADVAGKVVDRSTFLFRLVNDDTSLGKTKTMWKYACERTVSGTPRFLLNGVGVEADITWTFDDWKFLIDKLLAKKTIGKELKDSACPPGTTSCEYLPGKVKCCPVGQN